MSKEPEQRHIFIYLTSIIHWVGAGVTIGLLYSLFNIPVIAVVSLLILCFLVLPPVVRVVDGDEPDEQ